MNTWQGCFVPWVLSSNLKAVLFLFCFRHQILVLCASFATQTLIN